MDRDRLESLVKHLEFAPVECDGMARLVATVLVQHNIQYQGMVGSIVPKGFDFSIPHFWVQVGDLIIDYRAQIWLGNNDDVPHGVVFADKFEDIYSGKPCLIEPLPAALFRIMTIPLPDISANWCP
jgi:hypothetical protein